MKYLLVLLLTGCLPYALPPVTADVGPSRSSEHGARTNLHANVGYSPLHFSRAQARRFDATFGGSYDREAGNDVWGVSAAAGPVFRPWPHAPSVDRLLPQLVGRWTTEGAAVGVRVAIERATFANFTTTANAQSIATSYGEAAFGFYLETDVRFADERVWIVSAGLTLRMPATAGLACCL